MKPLYALSTHGREHDIFISYFQGGSQAVSGWLCERLRFRECLSVWFDQRAETDITAEGMEQGVSQSRNFLILLSPGYMSREFCNAECRWAKLYGCKIVGIVLPGTDFAHERACAPPDMKHLFNDVVFKQWQSKECLQTPMLTTILNQCEWPCTSDRSPLLGGSFVLVDDQPNHEQIIRELRSS